MTAPEDCALRTSERALVKTPPGGEKPGNDAFWFPADVLAKAGSAVTAISRSAKPAVISRPIQADERGIIIFADSKLVVFSRKHNETARPDLQVTFGRVCLTD